MSVDRRISCACARILSVLPTMLPGLVVVSATLGSVAVAGAQERSQDRGPGRYYGVASAPDRAPGTLRLATYNVLNLFDHADDPSLSGEFDDIGMKTSDDRCRAIAKVIRELDADVLALQEVESLEALRWFRDTYLKDLGYEYVASFDVGYYRGVEQSVLSRVPITDARVWPNLRIDDVKREGLGWAPPVEDGATFQRSPLMVDLKHPDGYECTLFVVHHKSGGLKFAGQREAEALKAMELVAARTARDPDRNVVILGDFNAAPWYKSTRVYLEAGFADVQSHRSTSNDAEESARYRTHESGRVIDYILMNRAAYREFVPGTAFILGSLHPGDDYDWRTDEPPSGYAADHYPLAIDLVPRDLP